MNAVKPKQKKLQGDLNVFPPPECIHIDVLMSGCSEDTKKEELDPTLSLALQASLTPSSVLLY